MTAPRLEVDLGAIRDNTRVLVDRLAPLGIGVTGVTKASLGSAGVARALVQGGATGLGDSRIENLRRLCDAGVDAPRTLIRSPMPSQVDAVVAHAGTSLNTEAAVLVGLSGAAVRRSTIHAVVLMVELGDLREGVAVADVVALARTAAGLPGLVLAGLGTNLACQCGVVPDQTTMDELSSLAEQVEAGCGVELTVISGGNSATLDWALATSAGGRVNDLRLGESILLGTEPLHRRPIDGLRTDAFALHAEVIELQVKPAQPWGELAQTAFGAQAPRPGTGSIRQAIVALGRQDVDPDGLTLPDGIQLLGASSDHLVLDVGDVDASVGDELAFGLGYSALLRAVTSPFVTKVDLPARTGSHDRRAPADAAPRVPEVRVEREPADRAR